MGFFGNIIKKATGFLGKGSPLGGLLEAAMPWGKALGFLGGAYLTHKGIQDEKDQMRIKKEQGRIGQADAISGGKFSFEDYNVKQGIAGDQFDLRVDSLGDALEMKSDSALDTFGRSNLQTGYQNTVMDTLQDQYSDGIASAELKYDQSTFANTQNLRQELSQYQTTYNSLGQYTNDLSYNFMENYKKLIG